MHSWCFVVFVLVGLLPWVSAVRLGATIPASSTCSYINSEYPACKVQAMCSLCITTGACEFNVDSLSCEAKAAANDTATTYCSSDDTACSTCVVTSADPLCRGEDRTCICQTLCSAVEPADCSEAEESIILYVGLAIGSIFVSSFVFLLVKCRRRYLAVLRQRTAASQHRQESEMLRMRQPRLALNLVGWRDTIHLDKPDLHKLGACCYVTNKDGTAGSTSSVAAIVVDEDEPSSSVETTSTFSEVQSPRLFELASASASSPAARDDACAYSAMNVVV